MSSHCYRHLSDYAAAGAVSYYFHDSAGECYHSDVSEIAIMNMDWIAQSSSSHSKDSLFLIESSDKFFLLPTYAAPYFLNRAAEDQ